MKRAAGSGRPRDPDVDERVLAAALQIVSEYGYDRATIDKIAAAAGVSRPTVYRRWNSKRDLVIEAMSVQVRSRIRVPDRGSLRADLIGILSDDHQALSTDGRFVIGVAAALSSDPTMASAVRQLTEESARERLNVMVSRAVTRGEIASDHAVDTYAFELAQVLILGRLILSPGTIEPEFIVRSVDDVLLPLIHHGRTGGTRA